MEIEEIRPINVGTMQRVGSKNDGGYVIPSDLPVLDELISFGLGDDSNFELECLKRKIVKKFRIFDHSVSTKILAKRALKRITTSPFDIKSIFYRFSALITYIYRFRVLRYPHLKLKIVETPTHEREVNILQIINEDETTNYLLKIDIEGGEYGLESQILNRSQNISLVIIEYHDTKVRRYEFRESISTIKKNYCIVHTHANNFTGVAEDGIPITLEITFMRKDLIRRTGEIFKIPREGVDSPSARNRPELSIEFS